MIDDDNELQVFETEEELVAFVNDHNIGNAVKDVADLETYGIYTEEEDIAREDWE